MMAMMAGLGKMMAPGDDGHGGRLDGRALATRAFGQYDLPIPRHAGSSRARPGNIDRFAAEWEIPVDEMRLWVLAHELAGLRRSSRSPHIRDALADLVRRHVGGFRPDPTAIAEKLGSLDVRRRHTIRWQAMQRLFGDPEVLLGAVRSPEQIDTAAAARRRGRRRRSATPTGWSTPSPCASSAATRCGSPRPSGAAASETTPDDIVRRAPARHPARRRSGGTRQEVRPGRRRPRRRARPRAACSPRLRPCRRRTRSTRPAFGSPE